MNKLLSIKRELFNNNELVIILVAMEISYYLITYVKKLLFRMKKMQSKIISLTFIVLFSNFTYINSSNEQTNKNILDSKSIREKTVIQNLNFLEPQWKINKSKSYENEKERNSRPIKLSKNNFYIELLLIVDKRLREKYNNDDRAILNRMKNIVSFVDILYTQFGIRVILLGVKIWKENPIRVTTNGTETLLNLLSYSDIMKRTITSDPVWKRVDTVHLMTGNKLKGEVVATGVFDNICASISGGIEVEDTQEELTALLLAHEIGHNLGLKNDDEDCSCSDGLLCIMRPSSPNSITSGLSWSDCTYERLKMKQKTFEKCLVINSPSKAGVCGNGIIESNEDCDCGTIEDCISTCCNPYNCKFKSGAVCDSGPCCIECQLAGPDKICRGNDGNDCDLIEYCQGDSEFCPEDIFKADGSTCKNSEGVCYKKACQSHNGQCRTLLGESAFSASNQCYNFINIIRKERSNSKKIKVFGSDALCSNLICCKNFEKENSNKSYFLDMVEILNQCKKSSVYLDVHYYC